MEIEQNGAAPEVAEGLTAGQQIAGDGETQNEQSGSSEKGREDDANGYVKRINKLTKRNYQQEAYVKQLEERLERLENPAKTEELTEEQRIAKNVRDEIRREMEAERQASQKNAEFAEKQDKFAERIVEAEKEFAGIRELLAEADDLLLPPAAAQAILDSEHGVWIAKHFVDNPAEAEAIAKMSPAKQEIALAKIEAKIEIRRELASSKTSQTKAEATPQAGGSDKNFHKGPPSEYKEYVAWRKAQEKKA